MPSVDPWSMLDTIGEGAVQLVSFLLSATYGLEPEYWILVPIALAAVVFACVLVVQYLFVAMDYRKAAPPVPSGGPPRHLASRMPPPYPNGWFSLCLSSDLKCGAVRDVSCLGLDLVAFRGKTGTINVMDKYCPHLGADLAVGGKVVGKNCLRCPFHGWVFDGVSGACIHAEYAPERTPPTTASFKTRVYTCREAYGMVFLWHHCDASVAPQWDIETPEGVFEAPSEATRWQGPSVMRGWRYHGRSEHLVACHVQEIPENGADVAHLNVLHPPFMYAWGTGVFTHDFAARWAVDQHRPHMSDVKVAQSLKVLGMRIPGTTVDVQVRQTAGFVTETFRLPLLGQIMIVESITPVRPLLQRATHIVLGQWWIPRALCKFILWGLVVQFERDVDIWNAKQFRAAPALLSDEKNITDYRRWYKKFYSDESVSFADAWKRQSNLEW